VGLLQSRPGRHVSDDALITSLAPLVRLSSDERYWPMAVEDFLADCTLQWATGKNTDVEQVAGRPVDPSKLLDWTIDSYSSSAYTRPFDNHGPQGPGIGQGFCLTLSDEQPRYGSQSTSDDSREYTGAPVYYEYDEQQGELTYWFFYGGSTAPLRFFSWLQRRGVGEEVAPEGVDVVSAAEAAQLAFPEVVEERGQAPLEVDRRFDPIGAAERALRRLRDYLELAPEFPFMHEGDWERITVFLDADRQPTSAFYYSHHAGAPSAWSSLELDDGHPVVYSAEGSHASFTRPGDPLDLVDAGGPRWETWHNLVDARSRPWFGFGGAWGRLGPIADATGPLGPSPWKRPAHRPTATPSAPRPA
jgi:hypothetical protein